MRGPGVIGQRALVWALAAVFALLTAGVGAAQTAPIRAYVTRIVDGDTIYVSMNGRLEAIRYIGINTPETRHPTKGREPGGEAATEANRRLVEGRWVTLTFDVQERDRYGRLLAYVWIDGRLVNAELVHQGYAQTSTYPPNVRYQEHFLKVERGAREHRRGLWGTVSAPAPAAASETAGRRHGVRVMRTLASVLAAMALSPLTTAHAAPSDDIRGYCAGIHQSYQIRLVCERSEREARDRLYRQVGLAYGIPRAIWDYCGRIHSSWQIMEVCTKSEMGAQRQIQGTPAPPSTSCGRFFCD
jgi:micrococcal nuclease